MCLRLYILARHFGISYHCKMDPYIFVDILGLSFYVLRDWTMPVIYYYYANAKSTQVSND